MGAVKKRGEKRGVLVVCGFRVFTLNPKPWWMDMDVEADPSQARVLHSFLRAVQLIVGSGIESKPFDQSDPTNPNRGFTLYPVGRYTTGTGAVSFSANHVANHKGDRSPFYTEFNVRVFNVPTSDDDDSIGFSIESSDVALQSERRVWPHRVLIRRCRRRQSTRRSTPCTP